MHTCPQCTRYSRAVGRASISSAQEPRADARHDQGLVCTGQRMVRTAITQELVQRHLLLFLGRYMAGSGEY